MFSAEDNKLQAGVDFFRDAATGELQKNPVFFHEHPFIYEQQRVEALFADPTLVRAQPNGAKGVLVDNALVLLMDQDDATAFRNVFLVHAFNAIGQNANLLTMRASQQLQALHRTLTQAQIDLAKLTLKHLCSNEAAVDFPHWQIKKLSKFGVVVHPTILRKIELDELESEELEQITQGAGDIFDEIDRLCDHFERSRLLMPEKTKEFKKNFLCVFKDITRNRAVHRQAIQGRYDEGLKQHTGVDMYYFKSPELADLISAHDPGIPYHIENHQPADPLARGWAGVAAPIEAPQMNIDKSMEHAIEVFRESYTFVKKNNLFIQWVNGEHIGGPGYCLDARTRTLESQVTKFRRAVPERRMNRNAWSDMFKAMEQILREYFVETRGRLVPEDRNGINTIDQLPEGLDAIYPMMSFVMRNYGNHPLKNGSSISRESVIKYLQYGGYAEPYNEEEEKRAAIAAYANQRLKAHRFDQIPPGERRGAVDLAIRGVDSLNIESPEEKAEYLGLLQIERQKLEGARPMLQQRQLVGADLEACLMRLPLPECTIDTDPQKNPRTFRQRPFIPYSPESIAQIMAHGRQEPEIRVRVDEGDVIPSFCAQNVFLIAARNAISNNRAHFTEGQIQRVNDAIADLEPLTIACAEHYLEQFCARTEELYNPEPRVVLEQVPAAKERIFRDLHPENPPSLALLDSMLDRDDPTIRYQNRLAGPGLQQPVARPQQAPAARPVVQPAPAARPVVQPPAQRPIAPALHAAAPQEPERGQALRAALAALGINAEPNAGVEELVALGHARVMEVDARRVQVNDVDNENEMHLQLGLIQARLAGPGLQQPVARPQQVPAARPVVQPAPAQRPIAPALHAAAPQEPEGGQALRAALAALGINAAPNARVEELVALGHARVEAVNAGRVQVNDVHNEEQMQLQLVIMQAGIEFVEAQFQDHNPLGDRLLDRPRQMQLHIMQPQLGMDVRAPEGQRLGHVQAPVVARGIAEAAQRQRAADIQAAAVRAEAERQERERQRLAEVERQRAAAAAEAARVAAVEAARRAALLAARPRR